MMLVKFAGTIAQDLVRELYNLGRGKLQDKIKYVILPWIKFLLIREVQRGLGIALSETAIKPDNPILKEVREYRKNPNKASFTRLAELLDYVSDITLAWGGEGYIQVAKISAQLEKEPTLTNLNKLIDQLHNTGGFQTGIFGPLAGAGLNIDEVEQELRMDAVAPVIDGLIKITEIDEELAKYHRSAKRLKELWNQLQELIKYFDERIEDVDEIIDTLFLKDLKHIYTSILFACRMYEDDTACDLVEKYREPLEEFQKLFKELISAVGGGDDLFLALLLAGKKDLEEALYHILPYEDKMERFKEELMYRQPHEKPALPDIISLIDKLAPVWCRWLHSDNLRSKAINEIELIIHKYVNPSRIPALTKSSLLILLSTKRKIDDLAADVSEKYEEVLSRMREKDSIEYKVIKRLYDFFVALSIAEDCSQINSLMNNQTLTSIEEDIQTLIERSENLELDENDPLNKLIKSLL